MPLTLLVSARAPALREGLVASCDAASMAMAAAHLVFKSELPNADVIHAQSGLAFFYLDADAAVVPSRFGAGMRAAVLLCDQAKVTPERVLRAQLGLDGKALVVPVHGADEAAEFILKHSAALTDQARRESAKDWIQAAFTASESDPREFAFRVAEALPIAADQTQILLESCGSLAAVARLGSAQAIMNKTPLSNADAESVARVIWYKPAAV